MNSESKRGLWNMESGVSFEQRISDEGVRGPK